MLLMNVKGFSFIWHGRKGRTEDIRRMTLTEGDWWAFAILLQAKRQEE
jgi:hypothetical protein